MAKELGISLNTCRSTYLKSKENISSKLATFSREGRKRAREPQNPDVDELC